MVVVRRQRLYTFDCHFEFVGLTRDEVEVVVPEPADLYDPVPVADVAVVKHQII